jgi:Grx4 family monothiol glutaredoxin
MFIYERNARCSSMWIFYGCVKYVKNFRSELQRINVLESQSLREGIKEFSDWPTIPQVYIKGEFVGGCDIVKEMYENGELKKVLEDKGINFKK